MLKFRKMLNQKRIVFYFILLLLSNQNTLLCFLRIRSLQGLKRSVTTLHGGTLGYAEIVAVKVFLSHKYVSTAVH